MHYGKGSEFILSIGEELAYTSKLVLRGYTVKQTDMGWMLILRVTDKHSKPLVCFLFADTQEDLWRSLWAGLYKYYNLQWMPDKYAD